ncbi:hypothetical protein AYO44_09340 [Planctomycetaceae bacterium SCGC AG-212-F19]|nr:hypothetical protein AYO44_09340 [Planctomycetaceae bacterium SCGC AG-212-F19]
MDGYTIAVTDPIAGVRKLAKIQPFNDGGFAVIAPYHPARTGYCYRMAIHRGAYANSRYSGVVRPELIEKYTASERVKLSYHADGFVQLSGESSGRITSGRDEQGRPKGLGLFAAPIITPIQSGPSVGVVAWGIGDYKAFTAKDQKKPCIIFDVAEPQYRRCGAANWNAYMLEVMVLPRKLKSGISRAASNRPTISLYYPSFEGRPTLHTFRVVELPGQPIFIGLLASRCRAGFPTPSRFTMSGPTDGRATLMAIYPDFLGESLPYSVDYSPGLQAIQPNPNRHLINSRVRLMGTDFLQSRSGLFVPEHTMFLADESN